MPTDTKKENYHIELSTIRLQSRETGVSLGKQGSFISSFFLYDFLYEFLSKLYTINHYPQGLNPAPGVPDNYAHIRQFNSWNQLRLRGTNPYRKAPRGWFGWDNWLGWDNGSRDTQAIPIITRYGGIKHTIVFSLLLLALTRPVFIVWSLCSRHR